MLSTPLHYTTQNTPLHYTTQTLLYFRLHCNSVVQSIVQYTTQRTLLQYCQLPLSHQHYCAILWTLLHYTTQPLLHILQTLLHKDHYYYTIDYTTNTFALHHCLYNTILHKQNTILYYTITLYWDYCTIWTVLLHNNNNNNKIHKHLHFTTQTTLLHYTTNNNTQSYFV